MMDKPFWKKGDVLALTTKSVTGGSVFRGCHVFEADSDPVLRGKDWLFGYRSQKEFRHATVEDIDRLIDLSKKEIERVANQEEKTIERLLGLKEKLLHSGQS